MVYRILLAAMFCAGASVGGLPMSAAVADDAAPAASPALDLADQPASDEDLKKESGSAVQTAGSNASGLMLPAPTDQAVGGGAASFNGGNSTISTDNSLSAVSTL